MSTIKRSKRLLTALALITLLAMLVTGCGGGSATSGQSEKQSGGSGDAKRLVVAIPEEIEGTDLSQINWENIVHYLLYEPLVTYDLELKELLPATAESYEVSEDGKEFIFKISKDATFSNGDPLTAEAIKKSIERHKEISPYGSDYDPVVDIEVRDPQTLVLKLDSPAAFLWPVLASAYGGVVDADKAEEVGKEEFNRSAVGNGPFYVKEWVQGSHIVLAKNPHYKTNNPILENKGPAYLDEVVVRFIPESFTRVSEIESGNVDVIYNVPTESLQKLQGNENIELIKYLQTGIDYISINTKVEPLNDVRVRKAIALAINKDEINQVLSNTVLPRYGLLSPAQLCYDENVENELKNEFAYNVEKAKQLLAEAGWKDENGDGIVEKNGKPLQITLATALDSPYFKQSAPIIQAQLQQAGIQLELREYEINYIKQMMKDHDYELATRYYWWSDPDILYYVFHSVAGFPWSDPEVDKMIDEARYVMDLDERTAKYAEIQRKVMEQVPGIPLFSEYQYLAVRNNVKGFKIAVDSKAYVNDVTKE